MALNLGHALSLGGIGSMLDIPGVKNTVLGTPSQQNPSFVAPFQQPYLENLYSRAQGLLNTPAINPYEKQGYGMALGAAQGLQPFISGTQNAASFLTNPNLLSPMSNPYLQAQGQAAINPIFQNLTESILPAIRGQAASTGNVGSSRQGIAEGIASRGALQSAGNTLANLYSGAYGQGLNAMGQGLSLAPSIANLGLLPSQVYQNVGQAQRVAPFQQLQNFQSLLGAPIVLGGGGTGSTPGLGSLINATIPVG